MKLLMRISVCLARDILNITCRDKIPVMHTTMSLKSLLSQTKILVCFRCVQPPRFFSLFATCRYQGNVCSDFLITP